MELCKDCKHYKMTLDGPYCLKSAGHPKPVSPIMAKDCFEERPAGEPASAVPMEKPGYVPRTKVCAKCGRELPMLQFSVNRRMKDGHQSECKECVAKTGRESRQRLNEKKRAERDKAVREQLEAGVKVCKKCGRTLPLSAFGKGHAADGLQANPVPALGQNAKDRKARRRRDVRLSPSAGRRRLTPSGRRPTGRSSGRILRSPIRWSTSSSAPSGVSRC